MKPKGFNRKLVISTLALTNSVSVLSLFRAVKTISLNWLVYSTSLGTTGYTRSFTIHPTRQARARGSIDPTIRIHERFVSNTEHKTEKLQTLGRLSRAIFPA